MHARTHTHTAYLYNFCDLNSGTNDANIGDCNKSHLHDDDDPKSLVTQAVKHWLECEKDH